MKRIDKYVLKSDLAPTVKELLMRSLLAGTTQNNYSVTLQ